MAQACVSVALSLGASIVEWRGTPVLIPRLLQFHTGMGSRDPTCATQVSPRLSSPFLRGEWVLLRDRKVTRTDRPSEGRASTHLIYGRAVYVHGNRPGAGEF